MRRGRAERASAPHCRGHREKIRQRQSVLPAPKGPAPIPFQRHGGDSPSSKNRVGPPVPLSEPSTRREPEGAGGGGRRRWHLTLPPASRLPPSGVAGRGAAGCAGPEDREGNGGSRGPSPHQAWAPPASPQPAATSSPRPGTKRQCVGLSLQLVGAPQTDPCLRSDPSKSSTAPWTTSSGSWLGCRRRPRLSNS